jgi:MOSC domain-containing protein YiiM
MSMKLAPRGAATSAGSLSGVQSGLVEGIYLASSAGAEPQLVDEASAVAGRGLEGDRYFRDGGTFSDNPRADGRDITLVEAEAVAGLARDTGIELAPGETRRNVVTRGLALNDLVGRRFTVGEVECIGRRLCDPCDHLQKLTKPGVLRGLTNRGGLRADILRGGRIHVGDSVVELEDA